VNDTRHLAGWCAEVGIGYWVSRAPGMVPPTTTEPRLELVLTPARSHIIGWTLSDVASRRK